MIKPKELVAKWPPKKKFNLEDCLQVVRTAAQHCIEGKGEKSLISPFEVRKMSESHFGAKCLNKFCCCLTTNTTLTLQPFHCILPWFFVTVYIWYIYGGINARLLLGSTVSMIFQCTKSINLRIFHIFNNGNSVVFFRVSIHLAHCQLLKTNFILHKLYRRDSMGKKGLV